MKGDWDFNGGTLSNINELKTSVMKVDTISTLNASEISFLAPVKMGTVKVDRLLSNTLDKLYFDSPIQSSGVSVNVISGIPGVNDGKITISSDVVGQNAQFTRLTSDSLISDRVTANQLAVNIIQAASGNMIRFNNSVSVNRVILSELIVTGSGVLEIDHAVQVDSIQSLVITSNRLVVSRLSGISNTSSISVNGTLVVPSINAPYLNVSRIEGIDGVNGGEIYVQSTLNVGAIRLNRIIATGNGVVMVSGDMQVSTVLLDRIKTVGTAGLGRDISAPEV
jgi:hypothetical protein